MAGIVGTITNLSDFLSKTQVCLSVKPNDPQQQIICLEADRKYSIPAFQREVRWDDNNLKMLLYDLSRSSKFLGNIILTIKSDHTCEIIDGQQRTTVLMLIVSCIKKKFGIKISTPDLCPLRNEGFTGFQTLLEKAFDQEAITSDDWNAILKSDDYHQLPRIQKLWNTISSSELLADRHKAQGLLDNLCKSEFNIIASYSNDVNTSIQYFLDVNLKGIRLDTEDIFKGYLFSQDSRELTRSLWQKNKRDVLRLNGVTQSSEEKRYPLMKLYEHFFYCDLYLPREGDCEYSTLKFGENFCLTSGFESGSTKYYEGSHLIEAIRDRDYDVEWVAWARRRVYMAYEFVYESEAKRYRSDCSDVLKETCELLKEKGISAQFSLIGSGARNMITRNGEGPYDLDYNLLIMKAEERYWNDLRLLKETVRNALNRAERNELFSDAQDSTSCLTALLHFKDTPNVEFSFDVAIIKKNPNGNYMRLIHNKPWNQYTWNEVPRSHQVKDRADEIKKEGLWQEVRDKYLEKKNMYLSWQDRNHPSFVVYVEAVNEVYNRYFNRGGGYSVQSIF